MQAKDDVYDALYVIQALRVQFVGYLDVVVGCSGDFECKECGRKLKEPQREVPGVGIVIVCLDIADTSVIVLELTLNDKIVAVVHRGIAIINTRGLAVERDLEVRTPETPIVALSPAFTYSLAGGSLLSRTDIDLKDARRAARHRRPAVAGIRI